MAKQVVFLSPHMDDFALSCSALARVFFQQGAMVRVHTFFTSFRSARLSELPQYTQEYLALSGFYRVDLFEKKRREEEQRCRELTPYSWSESAFVDAGFRLNHKQEPIYRTRSELLSGKISSQDQALQAEVEKVCLGLCQTADICVVPLGMSHHVDHLLVKNAAQRAVHQLLRQKIKTSQLWLYAEYPYALKPRQWAKRGMFRHLFQRSSFVVKREQADTQFVSVYTSQVPLLFPKGIRTYSERYWVVR